MKYYIILLSILFFVSPLKAEVYLEPYGNAGVSYSPTAMSSTIFMNGSLGSRVGYSFLSVSTGVEAFWTHYGVIGNGAREKTYDSSDHSFSKGFGQGINSVSLHSKIVGGSFQPWSVGLFAALKLPIWFNGYGTAFYTFGSKQAVKHHGYGVKMGLSYSLAVYVQLSLEFQWAHYICQATQCPSGPSFNIFSTALSLSVPLSFDVFNLIGQSDSVEPEETDFSSSAETETNNDDDESNVF